jgi:hypothetical protein
MAFFTYNKRGCEVSDTPPNDESIDREKLAKVLPDREVQDLNSVIALSRLTNDCKKPRSPCWGWSEGTILAAMADEQNKDVKPSC